MRPSTRLAASLNNAFNPATLDSSQRSSSVWAQSSIRPQSVRKMPASLVLLGRDSSFQRLQQFRGDGPPVLRRKSRCASRTCTGRVPGTTCVRYWQIAISIRKSVLSVACTRRAESRNSNCCRRFGRSDLEQDRVSVSVNCRETTLKAFTKSANRSNCRVALLVVESR